MKNHPFKIIPIIVLIAVFSAQCTGGNQVPSTSNPVVNTPESQNTQSATLQQASPEAAPTMAEPPSNPALDGKALAADRCTACHSFTRIETAKKTADEWTKNVQKMVSKGAVLTADEQKAVINYLSETYPK
jgi:cytochrome c5